MSDQSQGEGWWIASDGKWYPPHLHPDYRPPAAPPPPQPPAPQAPVSQQPAAQQQWAPQAMPPAGERLGAPPSSGPRSRSELKAEAAAAKARAKAMRPWYRKKRIMIPLVLVAIIAISVAASSGSDDDNKSANANSQSSGDSGSDDKPADQKLLHVGETDVTSGFEVTLVTVETPFRLDQFDSEPDPGSRYIGTEIQIKNTSKERKTMSSLLGLTIRDSEGQRYNVALVGLSRPQLDGSVEPGELLKGWSVFEVPTDATGLRLHIEGSLTASGADFDLGLG